MPPGMALLLGLVSALDRGLWAHSGSPSQPGIWAVPGAVIPLGSSVSIFCRVPPGVTALRLLQSEPRETWYERTLVGTQVALAFSLHKVTQNMAGTYSCHYWKRHLWSGRTESLELVVTGLFKDKPSLTAAPGPQVASGGNVTLLCRSLHPYDTYILCRGGASSPQGCSRQDHSSFLISPVSPDQAGTYTCCGCPHYSPQQCSEPSEPLVLSVTCEWLPRVFRAVSGCVRRASRADSARCDRCCFPLAGVTASGAERSAVDLLRGRHATSRPGGAMPPGMALLLGLVSALDRGLWAHSGSPSQPGIWAVPGAVIPLGSSVSIFCRVPPGVTALRLLQSEPRETWYERTLVGTQVALAFSLHKVTQNMAGTYSCHYWKRHLWSGRTESLELVVTGLFKDKPSLTAAPGPQVASGGNVTLLCRSLHPYDTYILCRGGASSPQGCSRQDHSSFLISPVSPDQAGTYTCCGCPHYSPQQCSEPSEPLVLSVTCPAGPTVTVIAAAAAAFLLLVLLLLLLLCLCRRQAKRRAAQGRTRSQRSSSPSVQIQGVNNDGDLEPEGDGQRDAQVSSAFQPLPRQPHQALAHALSLSGRSPRRRRTPGR
ncbi:leukocyte immunoglobulin-like receptor subfamily B member 5 [Fukomys damarensis]|uniref:leukocyte immunoglobulin-like receptor subfamily B member 5 n=1 Tax=Fukomys damarensis TaxID=885580 RepID=UPI0014553416|nr:leukocyte immunoglobulin-like receptor subfamily B member 5 [Fukomys damarensis]